jgi:hypothetical protein
MTLEEVKNEFFKKMSKVITDLKLSGTDIYNADESGLKLVNRGCKIIAPRARKTDFMRKSSERSENIIVAARNATGTVTLPPMTIYKDVRTNEDLMNGAAEDKIFATSLKDYIDSDEQNKGIRVEMQLQEVMQEESYSGGTVSGAKMLTKNIFYEYGCSFGDVLHGESWIQC